MIHFEIPKNQSSILKVIGVGGGGSNAVNYMHSLGIEGVDFVVCNTDSKALAASSVPNKIQLGPHLTQGLGAGANPEVGMMASEESLEDITKILKVNTKMAFITAGMGGGTGTGGAPVVAKVCREQGILTVGIVTTPFSYEGRKRMKQAQEGIDRMKEHVDTILIISNDKLRQQYGNLPFTQAFAKADDVLATAAKCITDIIGGTGTVIVDFADVCTVMRNGGVAILGNAAVSGENRALKAVEEALSSPLLNDSDIRGAKWILLNINSAPGEHEHTLDELDEIQAYVQQQAGENCDLILGVGHDPNLGDKIGVTVIATGFNHKDIKVEAPARAAEPQRVIMSLDEQPAAAPATAAPKPAVQPQQQPAQPQQTPNFAKPFTATESMKMDIREEAAPQMQMTMRETTVPAANTQQQQHDAQAEAQRLFEEQKRLLEERAERLKKLSFSLNGGTENAEDVENVPAYMRRNVNLNNDGGSTASNNLSGYSVGMNDHNSNGAQATIQTINTFLDGKKPD